MRVCVCVCVCVRVAGMVVVSCKMVGYQSGGLLQPGDSNDGAVRMVLGEGKGSPEVKERGGGRRKRRNYEMSKCTHQ